jgi:hypothetical protein
METSVIYQKEDGTCGVMQVSPESELTPSEIAQKDVEFGMHFILVPTSELPEPAYYSAIEVDFSIHSDGRGLGSEIFYACKDAEAEGTYYSYEFDDEPEQEMPEELYEKALAEGLIDPEPEPEAEEDE